eukprot:TRINITY_DN4506_c0_g1_i1.p1 TRINITY_DN4506_c0_g1~~TRINITY_DN4506_c0_g1_i1.p1  ORF type:complete len:136 (-),score=19.11 TRINITY_DN4506_c0_g1_i1:23-430(-)
MPLKNGVIQGYVLVKQPPPPLLYFHGKPVLNFKTLGQFIRWPHRYENLRFAFAFGALVVGAHLGNKHQRTLKAEWEENMRIQKRLHPAGVWSEETAHPAADKLQKPKPGHTMRVFEGGYQMFDLKPKLFDPDEEH